MTRHTLSFKSILPAVLLVVLSASAATAQKPGRGGHGDDGKREENEQGDDKREKKDKKDKQDKHDRQDIKIGGYFNDHQRVVIRDYYGTEYRAGRCPPGLAKKNNGCMPPGQAKKWAMGRPLSRDVEYYPVPRSLINGLGVPPTGYRYVRVSNDVLLLALGTNLIVDAIQGSGRP